ncbi:hypothetical protein D910_00908 [Dendroctonus ponderosae]|uniref:Uncharacterized protein n=1 Tax=Dendroctonus ponderosae TaxID=77166 RepID=U4UU51_DENPD|nr:hypothetical protein D910_00557 [Dendroctonus ponderosae]ERL96063.1 hypothetical protein D910_00908 [Dendroctonus ponderosae]KAH1001070.1 hypothetical protein HUJ04_013329 [Dendroctonus ponderosae]
MFIAGKAFRRRKREENEETAHNLFKSSTTATKSAISTHTISGPARTGRIGCQLRINTNSDYSRSSAYGSQEFPSKLFGEKHFLQKRKGPKAEIRGIFIAETEQRPQTY